jgi:translation initiation factor 2 beta subunit (eIF-2beta)/eIF-5
MSQVNIGADNNDPFYRYKRDVIQTRTEHKHGVQTRLLNLFTIAKQLHVSEVNDLVSALKKTLGVNLTVDRASQSCIIQSSVPVSKLESAINRFIEQYILCRKCRLPELQDGVCLACGVSQALKGRRNEQSDQSELITVADLTERAKVKYEQSFERTCCMTITEMLDWHQEHQNHPRYRLEWEPLLDELRASCWTCQSEVEANGRRKRWIKLRGALSAHI